MTDDTPINRSLCLHVNHDGSDFPARCKREWQHDGLHKSGGWHGLEYEWEGE